MIKKAKDALKLFGEKITETFNNIDEEMEKLKKKSSEVDEKLKTISED